MMISMKLDIATHSLISRRQLHLGQLDTQPLAELRHS